MKRLFTLSIMSSLVFHSCVGMTAIIMPSTVDGTINTNEVPEIPLAKAQAIAIADLGTNAPLFVCTSAVSIRKENCGGWRMLFCSRTLNARYIHVTGDGQVLASNETSPKGGHLKAYPSMPMQEAVISVTNSRGIEVVSVVWVDIQDEWQIYALTENGINLFTVDSKKRVRQEKKRKSVPVPK